MMTLISLKDTIRSDLIPEVEERIQGKEAERHVEANIVECIRLECEIQKLKGQREALDNIARLIECEIIGKEVLRPHFNSNYQKDGGEVKEDFYHYDLERKIGW